MNTIRGMQSSVEHLPGVGDVVGRYRLIGSIADGRSGPLYLAEQVQPACKIKEQHAGVSFGLRRAPQAVAVRCIRPELAQSQRYRERFFEAARVAARCEHPNVVRVFEMAEARGGLFVSMEYLPGESLAEILSRCRSSADLTVDIAAHLIKRVASAVQHVRALAEVLLQPIRERHVEVDSSNVIVTHGGAIKWLGAASPWVANGVGATGIQRLVPSVSPDQSASPGPCGGASSEAFELGVLLWTCLLPQHPAFRARGSAQAAAVAGDAKALRSARADIPDALAAIVLQALAEDHRERFQSVLALSDALDRYLLRRDCRTTPDHLRRWMERVFGAERSALQQQIAAGREGAGALELLRQWPPTLAAVSGSGPRLRPRPLWATGHAASRALSSAPRTLHALSRPLAPVNEAPADERPPVSALLTRRAPAVTERESRSPGSASGAPRPARAWLPALLAGAGTFAAFTAFLTSSPSDGVDRDAARPRRPGARVAVASTPPGAAVFVDGEPSGALTPAVLEGLPNNRPILVRVAKAGYVAEQRQVELPPDTLETLVYELVPAEGLALFGGVPRGARIYVDGEEVDGSKAVSLPVGSHAVRVEAAGALTFSERVVIVAGEQTIRVAAARGQ